MKKIKCRHCGAENEEKAKTCDDCGRYMGGSQSVSSFDPHHGRCAWESDGHRCHFAGTLADGNLGSDTWYCRGHYGLTDGTLGRLIVEDSYRSHPYPDFSLDARRAASLRKAEAGVPDNFRGWTVEEYRTHCRAMLGSFKSKVRVVQP